jgi:Zn-dependent protease
MQTDIIFSLVVLIFSVILHEVAHGYMANWLGDPTARLQGRLTLNPLVHIDPVGSVLLPALLIFSGSPMLIGYAKPVPYNPYNLSGEYDEALVAFAGPGTNILLAVLFGLILRFAGTSLAPGLSSAFATIVLVNLVLAIFNLIPIPPLDGSKALQALLPRNLALHYEHFRRRLEGVGVLTMTIVVLIVFYFLLLPYFYDLVTWLFTLLTGSSI